MTLSKRFLPVIHVENYRQTLSNTQLALDAGAHGVFIINHGVDRDELLSIAERLLDKIPDLWLGVNCLGSRADEVIRFIDPDIKAYWSDGNNPYVKAAKKDTNRRTEYFGGVAFKYQKPVKDVAAAAKTASSYMDVVTTSGPGTGKAAELHKVKTMKEAIGDHRLGVASGITPANVEEYLPYVDDFLVATGISLDFHNLDYLKTQKVAVSIRGYKV